MAGPDGDVDIEFHLPLKMTFRLDEARVERAVGNRLAKHIRGRIRQGTGLRTGTDLKETGSLIRSIRYDRKAGVVRPSTRRRQGVSNRAGSNYGLMRIYISGKFRKQGYQRLEPADPMGSRDPNMRARVAGWVQEAVDDEVRAGRASIWDIGRRRGRRR